MNLKINESFNRLLGQLTDEELKALEASILEDGVREPIITWNGTIIDGHNRYRIATKHGLTFTTKEMEFENAVEAELWIIANQFARRNLTEEMKAYLRGKRYEKEKERHGGDRKSEVARDSRDSRFQNEILRQKRWEKERSEREDTKKSTDHNDQLKNSTAINAFLLAAEYNVAEPTIRRDADFSVGVDAIAMDSPEEATKILAGKSDLTKSQIQEIGKVVREVDKSVEQELKEKEAVLKKEYEPKLRDVRKKLAHLDQVAKVESESSILTKKQTADKKKEDAERQRLAEEKRLIEEAREKERQRLEVEARKVKEERRRQQVEAERQRQNEEAERKEAEKEKARRAKFKEEEKLKEEEKRLQKRAERQRLAYEGAKKSVGSQVDFRLGDFEEVFKDLPDGSVDCIITDPPYPKEFIDCWERLGRFAKRVLKPNGFCIAYSGQMNLPEVIGRLGKNLDYYWTFAVYHEGQTQIVNGVNLICRWKPVLIYQNGKKKLEMTIQDYFISELREKSGHDWQQSESGVAYLVDRFTIPGDVILDPFAGSGTTLVVAVEKQRIAKGAEIDEQHYNIAKARL